MKDEVRESQLEIFEEFKKLKTGEDKAKYCERMDETTKQLKISWLNLAKVWRNNLWPRPVVEEEEVKVEKSKKEKKKAKENKWIQSYVDPVGQTDQEKTLTKEELDAIL